MDAAVDGDQRRQGEAVSRPFRLFINYRHEDTWALALLLRERLANSFGTENVFLDAHDLQPGMKWLDMIEARSASSDVLLSLIGPRWISILKERERAASAEPAQDYVRFEIEQALKPNSGIHVIPVLVGDVLPLAAEKLPGPLRPLATIQAAQLRQRDFENDVAELIGKLEAIAREQPDPAPLPVIIQPDPAPPPLIIEPRPISTPADGAVPAADAAHFDVILHQIVDVGNLVPVLGSRLRHGGAADGPGSLLSAEELAADLAARFGVTPTRLDLAEIAQQVYVTHGRPDLYTALKEILTADCKPGPVHRFLAGLPQALEELGLKKRHQLIVSTSFDRALEQAFEAKQEPYDLAVYMADEGKFLHFPYEQTLPVRIAVPNTYLDFPIGEDFELERTVIVKIHGAVDGNLGSFRWKGNYVITQDHYIDFLSKSPIESLVPVQVLDKLRESHCLFLGYTVRDWNLRVFLKRIWAEGRIESRSWAVEPDPDALEREFWDQSSVKLYAADLAEYVGQLQQRLAGRAPQSGEPS